MDDYPDDVKRTETLTFVTTLRQKEDIVRNARLDEMTISEYLRNLVRQDIHSPAQRKRRLAIESDRTTDALIKHGRQS